MMRRRKKSNDQKMQLNGLRPIRVPDRTIQLIFLLTARWDDYYYYKFLSKSI